MKFFKKYWYIVILLLISAGGIGWKLKSKPAAYREFTVEKGPLQVMLSASGTVRAENQADLAFQTGGRLSWVGVKKGDRVKKWQGIASLDQRTVQNNLEKELNDYLKTRWDFQGNRETYNVTTDNLDRYTLTPAVRRLLEKSQFDLNNSVLDVELQSVVKEFSLIVSPFSGLITNVSTPNPGVNVSAGSAIATVIDPDSMYFEARIDEVDIAKIKIDAPVQLILDAYPEEIIEARIVDIDFSPISLSGGGTGYAVKISLPPQTNDLKFKLGLNGNADIIMAKLDEALILSPVAVIQKDGRWVVKVKRGKEIVEQEVNIGWETENKIEIKSGLAIGDQVYVNK
ncbi:efflux RND transporter periplasmic adaptor subunit [Candidatus Collierbacteria bacterium]|nr:efflux RND transporter periplasmic adaptor subunit [Candidatus Collierbacteria bacterium]